MPQKLEPKNLYPLKGDLEYDKLLLYIKSHCHSQIGIEYLSTFTPSKNKVFIVHRLNLINDIQKIILNEGDIGFYGLSDVNTIFTEVKSLAFNFDEFKAIIGTVKIANRVIAENQKINNSENHVKHPDPAQKNNPPTQDYETYFNFTAALIPFPALEERFNKIFDDEGNVLDSASTELKNIRQRVRKLKEKIQSELHKTLNDNQTNIYLQDKIVTQRNDRFVVPVKEGFANVFDGISHGRSGSGSSIYIEPKSVVPLNNEINELYSAEKEEIYRIFCEFTKQILIEKDHISINFEILFKLDTYFACARVSNELQSIVPEIVDENLIELRRARHPLLIINFKSIKKVIPFNLFLGNDFRILLISGPNTGGKTVTLKTIGLCTLMAMTGLPIPADFGSRIGLFSNVFADIGDNQSIESSLSTFSGHIENIKQIVDNGNENTLVLIDEIGSATDPEQGAALAQAILEHIIEKNSLAVITTHYTSLKIFVENTENCVNASMQFDPQKLEPTYQFVLGFPGNSFAIEIASKLGLNQNLVKRAEALTGSQNVELTDLLKKMNEEKRKLAENNYQFELKTRLLEMKISEFETKIKDFDTEKKQRIKSSLADTQSYLTGIQKRINEELTDIKALAKEEKKQKLHVLTNKVKAIQNEIYEKKEKIDPIMNKNQTINIGDKVWIISFDTMAVIIEKNKDFYRVDMNGIFYNVKKDDLYKIVENPNPEKDKNIGYVSHKNIEYSGKTRMELNLLGKTFEESLPLIQDLIDNALFCGLSKVRIVHGRGTGILRQKIREYLKKNDKIQDFYSPPHEAGGDGVTVVAL
ncbi:MAG: endonuclease MutS2 [Candidatus Cloacimonetes bacterium]|nr:endonuclease MutS2 [Candidatus Cloacimonadota bacterium]